MSILFSLEQAYHRLKEEGKVPPIGYSNERIGYCIVLNADGQPIGPPADLRDRLEKKNHNLSTPSSATREAGGRSDFAELPLG